MTTPPPTPPAVLEFRVFPQMNNEEKRRVEKLTSLQMEREGGWGASEDFFHSFIQPHGSKQHRIQNFYEEQLFFMGRRPRYSLVLTAALVPSISQCKQLSVFGQQMVPEHLFG